MSQEKKAELAGRISKKLSSAEARLFGARRDLHELEAMVMEGRKLDMIEGDLCMDYVCQLGVWQGDIARIEGLVYPVHAEFTAIARDKKNNVDVEGPYLVLARYMPDVDTRSGGGRR